MLLAVFSHLLLALLAQLDSMAMVDAGNQSFLGIAMTEPGLTTVRRRGRRACSSRSSATRSSSSFPSSTSQACTAGKAFSALAPRKVFPQPIDWGCFRGFTCVGVAMGCRTTTYSCGDNSSTLPGEAKPSSCGRRASVKFCSRRSYHKHSTALLAATGVGAASAA